METKDLQELLDDMSLEEKIGQLIQLSGDFFEVNNISIGPKQKLGITQKTVDLTGSLLNVTGAEITTKIQKEQMAKQPHHIPVLFMSDVIYGYKTIYPIPLGLGATWNPNLIEKAFQNTAHEAASSGNHVTFAPMVDVVHDARWGRVLESPGEDPLLNAKFAKAMVSGFQKDLDKGSGQVSCVKHFAAYGAAEGGREYNSADMSISNLFQNYLPPYKAAVDAGAKMVMTSLNTLNGIPATADKALLVELLRKSWAFSGTIISDYASIFELIKHGFAADQEDATQKAFDATVDIDMKSPCYANNLPKLVEDGRLSLDRLDEAVWRILTLKNELGLFEDPFKRVSIEQEKKSLLTDSKRKLARQVAAESLVLLKNNDNVLPLNPKAQKIALIGPYSDSKYLLGMWAVHGNVEDTITIRQGMESYLGKDKFKVANGTDISRDYKMLKDMGYFSDEQIDQMISTEDVEVKRQQTAIETAKKADTVILALGEHTLESGEAGSKTLLRLPENQQQLLDKICKLGKKVILVLISGRPLVLKDVEPKVDAIIQAWFPGTEGGNAIADVILGKINPSGRLSMSFPYIEGQEPIYYSHLITGRPQGASQHVGRFVSRYIDTPTEPMYPFGYGLSYGEIEYSDFVLRQKEITQDETLTVSLTLKNNSSWDCLETVQLYLHDKVASVVQPVKRLIDFKKVFVKAQQQLNVEFEITSQELEFFDNQGQRVLEAGAFELFVGPNSRDVLKESFTLVGES
ncbi:beta-glucosidase BglX [Ligilactobacillus sp. WILCCON 0076]|uniref:beta-glucosidase n=1 Tax=Ligilactobacillus ubinensis TaxID=2876789 RepID=A0A9X2JPV2_9LACO|nr:beta-glucosidase BglX [Ligilactobacillus ubinensis]MCP0888091.1 beta-glucosidase BglX [Ligilactobacillus ubinensis]